MNTRISMLCPVGLGEICNRKKKCNCSSNKYNICFKKNNFNGFSYKRYNICINKLFPIENNIQRKKYRYSDAILKNSGQISFCKSNLYEFTKNQGQRRINSCKCCTKKFSIFIKNRKFSYLGSCNGVHCNIPKNNII